MAHEKFYLQNILEAIEKIGVYIEGYDEASFQADGKTQDAVIRQLMIIGEAVRLLPEEIKEAYPQIPWRDVSGMRNHLIHRYFKVDMEEVWRTTQNDLTVLQTAVELALADIDGSGKNDEAEN